MAKKQNKNTNPVEYKYWTVSHDGKEIWLAQKRSQQSAAAHFELESISVENGEIVAEIKVFEDTQKRTLERKNVIKDKSKFGLEDENEVHEFPFHSLTAGKLVERIQALRGEVELEEEEGVPQYSQDKATGTYLFVMLNITKVVNI